MCINCWEEYKEDRVVNDKVIKAKDLIDQLYEISSVGGNLHIVLDDWNLDSVEWCKQLIDKEDDPNKKDVELSLYELLITMSEAEIVTALAAQEGFITLT